MDKFYGHSKRYNCPRNENKGSRNKAKKRISVVRRPTVSSSTEFIFFRGKTFIHTKRSNELAEYEKEKKIGRQGRKRKRFLRDPRTRHPPIYIIASSTRAFSPNPPSFAGVHVSRSTAFSRDFVLSEELKMVHQELAISFQLRQKYRYFFIRGFLCLPTFITTKYRYYISTLCKVLYTLARFKIREGHVTANVCGWLEESGTVRTPHVCMHDFSRDAYERAEKERGSHLKNELESLLTLLMLHHASFRHVLAKVYSLIRFDCDPARQVSSIRRANLWLNDCITICWQCSCSLS